MLGDGCALMLSSRRSRGVVICTLLGPACRLRADIGRMARAFDGRSDAPLRLEVELEAKDTQDPGLLPLDDRVEPRWLDCASARAGLVLIGLNFGAPVFSALAIAPSSRHSSSLLRNFWSMVV